MKKGAKPTETRPSEREHISRRPPSRLSSPLRRSLNLYASFSLFNFFSPPWFTPPDGALAAKKYPHLFVLVSSKRQLRSERFAIPFGCSQAFLYSLCGNEALVWFLEGIWGGKGNGERSMAWNEGESLSWLLVEGSVEVWAEAVLAGSGEVVERGHGWQWWVFCHGEENNQGAGSRGRLPLNTWYEENCSCSLSFYANGMVFFLDLYCFLVNIEVDAWGILVLVVAAICN